MKQRKNAPVWRKNVSIPDKNYDKDERANFIDEDRYKRSVIDL